MAKKGKRYRSAAELVEEGKAYSLDVACELVAGTPNAKFDETVEVALRLGVDPRKADQNVRGSVSLPHGLGKTVRVAVFAKGDKAEEARAAGADVVGAEDLVEEVQGGRMDFDAVVATPDMMAKVGKIGKVLGPRGLMPSPKVGTVTFDVGDTVQALKAGRVEYRVEKAGIVHAGIGKKSFGSTKLRENIESLVQALNRVKPSTSKGLYLQSGSVCSTMGPGVKFDVVPLRNL